MDDVDQVTYLMRPVYSSPRVRHPLCLMTRSSNTDKTHRLNAAFDLLAKGYTLAEAAEILAQQFGLSRRQAYRYLQDAQEIDAPVWVASPAIPITIKIPADVVSRLRSYAQASGMTIGEIVAQAIVSFLDKLHRHG